MALQSQIGINLSSGYEPGWVGGKGGSWKVSGEGRKDGFFG
jgi:hypothetical protein